MVRSLVWILGLSVSLAVFGCGSDGEATGGSGGDAGAGGEAGSGGAAGSGGEAGSGGAAGSGGEAGSGGGAGSGGEAGSGGTAGIGGGAGAGGAAGSGGMGGGGGMAGGAGAAGAGGMAGIGGMAGVGGGLPSGACVNDDDLPIVCDETFADEVGMCGSAADGDPEATATCLVENTSVSADCADCFAALTACIVTNCFDECTADPNSQECGECQTANGCDASQDQCAGDLGTECQ